MTFTCEEPFLGDSILKTQRGKDSRILLQYAESAQNSRAPGRQSGGQSTTQKALHGPTKEHNGGGRFTKVNVPNPMPS